MDHRSKNGSSMKSLNAALSGLALLCAASGLSAAGACEVDRPIVIAGLNWDSNAFHAAVASRILQDGYGCQVEIAPGATRPLFKAMTRGEVHITMEVWKDNLPKLWPEAIRKQQVIEVGINLADAVQGWFVPRYLVEGVAARAPGLSNVEDLPRYKQVFADPEERAKGRFYNCMLGWGCEKVNSAKLHAYGLAKHFTNFRPASGAALEKAISKHYRKKEPFLAYYWGPTWILGEYDLVMLEEPTFDPAIWKQLARERKPSKATAYPVSEISIGTNTAFADKAPQIIAFLQRYRTSNKLVSQALASMNRSGQGAAHAADQFMKIHEVLWRSWVPADVADRVSAKLSES
jgi:glycine betaine/proline transport system substrate-binding protein